MATNALPRKWQVNALPRAATCWNPRRNWKEQTQYVICSMFLSTCHILHIHTASFNSCQKHSTYSYWRICKCWVTYLLTRIELWTFDFTMSWTPLASDSSYILFLYPPLSLTSKRRNLLCTCAHRLAMVLQARMHAYLIACPSPTYGQQNNPAGTASRQPCIHALDVLYIPWN